MVYERVVRSGLALYRSTLSPLIGRRCRFLPTCSEYAAQALIEHGPLRGGGLAVRRVCRCRPFGGRGFDPPPPALGAQRLDRLGRGRSARWKCEA